MRKSEAYNIISEFSEKIDDPDNFEYNDVIAVFNKTVDALKEYPDLHKYIDADFMRSLHTNYVKDLYLEYSRVFMQIMKSKNTEEQKKYLRELDGVDKKLSKDLENYAVENNLELIDITFAKRLKMLYASTGPNENSDIMNLILNAPTAEKCEQMLECVFDDKVPVVCRNKNLLFIDNVYRQHPELTDKVFEIIKKNKDSKCFFAVLADIAVFDENKAEEALCCMHARVQEGPVDEFWLQKYYDKMKAVCDKLPKFKYLAQEFCREALCLPQNNKNCKKLAARLLEDEQSLYSQVSIGEKTEKSTSNPFGYHKVERIGADEVCVLFIGGNGTRDDKAAHGYIKPAVELLKEYDLDKSVSVYGTTYDFGDYFNTDQALDAQMQKYGHKSRFVDGVFESVHDETKNPQFIKQIFDMFILPRISRLNGKIRLPAEEAAKKMNKLKIVAHCFGGYAALKIEEMSLKTMEELGYTPQEQKFIQGQMQVLAMNPYCPLGVQKSDMFSIVSAQDREVTHNNFFEIYIRRQVAKGKIIPLCYFEKKLGNFMLINRMYGSDNRRNSQIDGDEHNYFGFKILPAFSEKGKMAMRFMQNALINGLQSAVKGELRPLDTKNMLCVDENDCIAFEEAKANGKTLYKQMVEYTLAENNKIFEKNKK